MRGSKALPKEFRSRLDGYLDMLDFGWDGQFDRFLYTTIQLYEERGYDVHYYKSRMRKIRDKHGVKRTA